MEGNRDGQNENEVCVLCFSLFIVMFHTLVSSNRFEILQVREAKGEDNVMGGQEDEKGQEKAS